MSHYTRLNYLYIIHYSNEMSIAWCSNCPMIVTLLPTPFLNIFFFFLLYFMEMGLAPTITNWVNQYMCRSVRFKHTLSIDGSIAFFWLENYHSVWDANPFWLYSIGKKWKRINIQKTTIYIFTHLQKINHIEENMLKCCSKESNLGQKIRMSWAHVLSSILPINHRVQNIEWRTIA